jgi:hypothetical protein
MKRLKYFLLLFGVIVIALMFVPAANAQYGCVQQWYFIGYNQWGLPVYSTLPPAPQVVMEHHVVVDNPVTVTKVWHSTGPAERIVKYREESRWVPGEWVKAPPGPNGEEREVYNEGHWTTVKVPYYELRQPGYYTYEYR